MPLELDCRYDGTLPIEVDGLLPEKFQGDSVVDIQRQKIWLGRDEVELGQLFLVRGDCFEDLTCVWSGNLKSVHSIGARMTKGQMLIETSAGRHVGSRMTGGSITVRGSVSDFVGAEMRGGEIEVAGDAGDLVGANYPGSKIGMNRGAILIRGDAGRGVGQTMRRGTISIGGHCGILCGWNMLAGSIVVFGNCDPQCGPGMKRGTIVLAGASEVHPLPSFAVGGTYHDYTLAMLGKWLRRKGIGQAERLQSQDFQMYHGDRLNGGRGELFIAR